MKVLFVLIILLTISCTSNKSKNNVVHDTIIVHKVDTIFVHDTVHTSKKYGDVDVVNIGN